VVKETDAGIIIRGAKYETAAAYADQAFLKPTVGAWSDEKLSDYALGCIVKMGAPGVKHICRSGFAGRGSKEDYPLSNGYDEVDTLMVLDNVLIPWEDVFFHRFTEGARYIRGTLHRYSAFPYVLRILYTADMMIGAAQKRVRMMAKQFCETGIKDLFMGVHDLLRSNATLKDTIRLRNRWVAIDPSSWQRRKDMVVQIGIGSGGRDHDLASFREFYNVLTTLAQDPSGDGAKILNAGDKFNFLDDYAGKLGLKGIDKYLTDPVPKGPDGQPLPPGAPGAPGDPTQAQQPSPEDQKAAADAQAKQMAAQQAQEAHQQAMVQAQQKMQIEAQVAQQKAQIDAQSAMTKAQSDMQVAQYKAQQQAQLARDMAAHEAEVAQQKADLEARVAQQKAQAEYALAQQKAQWEADLANAAMERQHQLNATKLEQESHLPANRPGGDLSE
jgi:hypothetical protein